MSSTPLRVTCPHCGAVTPTTTGPEPQSNDQLKGTVDSCSDCENAFELYYYY